MFDNLWHLHGSVQLESDVVDSVALDRAEQFLAAFMAFWVGFRGGGAFGGVKFAAGTFAWLYGMNVLLARFRVPSAIRRAATNA